MDDWIAGIDLGTSSVKVLCVNRFGDMVGASQEYGEEAGKERGSSLLHWWSAIGSAFRQLSAKLDLHDVAHISLTAQVGTYILYSSDMEPDSIPVISWRDKGGAEQLRQLKAVQPKEYFLKHISMPHPELISYPAPRFLWFQQERRADWEAAEKLLQPKDYIYHRLTGVFASDRYSWRGLANQEDGDFHDEFLRALNVPRGKLPELHGPDDAPGALLPGAAAQLGLNAGIPVFIGCNDFYASLLGMGVATPGQCFDMTGTSEHLGLISDQLNVDTKLICSPYFNGFVHYGVTANSGTSLSWAIKVFVSDCVEGIDMADLLGTRGRPPIFLPYMLGERAPVWDENARGVFFGLESGHTSVEMAYAVLEGVAFSLFHIWSGLPGDGTAGFRAAGGAARNDGLNKIKATLFGRPFTVMKQRDSAALGAVLFAAVGLGWFDSLEEGAATWAGESHTVMPDTRFAAILKKRFEIYVSLYPALKDSFERWNDCR